MWCIFPAGGTQLWKINVLTVFIDWGNIVTFMCTIRWQSTANHTSKNTVLIYSSTSFLKENVV